jgi:ElaB/YqjD/DUF883 family membrane-anchored ribosome-binding protein
MEKTRSRKVQKTEKDLYHDLLKIKSALTNTADGVKSRAGNMVTDMIDNLHSTTHGIQDEVEDYITTKPLKTLGIAVLIGIIVGKVIL